MIYHFKHIENGQIAEGYTVLDINDHEAEAANDDAEAILLAEKNGGELALPEFSMDLKGKVTGKKRVFIEAGPGENILISEGSTD